MVLKASPEFKGIKTRSYAKLGRHAWLKASPEFKGIKTRSALFALLNEGR